jgi:hypothetical protein
MASCPVTPVEFRAAYSWLTPAGSLVRDRSILSSSRLSVVLGDAARSAGRQDGLIFLNSQGAAGVERAKRVAYRNLALPTVSVPGEYALTGAASWAGLADWLMEFALWGLLILFVTGVLATVALFVTVSRELGPLAGQGADPRLFLGVALWNVTVPLAAAVLLSAATAAALGKLLVELGRSGAVDVGFLAATTLLATAVVALVGLLCARFAAVRAASCRPVGD